MAEVISKIKGWLRKDDYKLTYKRWEKALNWVILIGMIAVATLLILNWNDKNLMVTYGVVGFCLVLVYLCTEIGACKRRIKELMGSKPRN